MKARRVARLLALETLYQAEIRDEVATDAWIRRQEELDESPPDDLDEEGVREARAYAGTIVRQVVEGGATIDALISKHGERWALERMPILDRCIARIAAAELLADNVPVAVVANEAVELAKELSTDDSPRYLNGLIGRLAEVIAEGRDDPAGSPT